MPERTGSAKEYVDFEIELERLDDPEGRVRYEVKAKCRGGTARQVLDLPFLQFEEIGDRESQIERASDRIGEIVAQIERAVYYGQTPKLARGVALVQAPDSNGDGAPDPPKDADSVLAEFGHTLYMALLGGRDISRLFDRVSGQVEGLRIRLSLNLADPYQRALSQIPWECLKERNRADLKFLSAIESSPFVRDVEIGDELDKPSVEGALKILLVTANPEGSDELGLDDEERVIRETFDELRREGRVVVDELPDASWEELSDHLSLHSDYHVIHYMGHGHYDAGDENRRGRGGMLLLQGQGEDGTKAEVDKVDADQLALILQEKTPNVRLMFINACNTGVETKGGGAPFGGLATRILETGIPAVIAMQFMIEDNSAIRFSRAFYKSISMNQPVDQAVSLARQVELVTKRQDEGMANHWLTPVLYMRAEEDGRLFEHGETGRPARRRGIGDSEPESAREARPEPSDPPATVANDEPAIWLTEWRNKLVLNWRVSGEAEYGDLVALFDGEPSFPYGWLGIQYESARDQQLFVTDRAPDEDRYYIAYLRPKDGEYEIIRRSGPYRRDN